MNTDSDIKKLLEQAVDIPTLPEITQQVLALANDPDASLLSLSGLIKKDAALSARILKLVNSPFVGVAREITNIRDAVPLLGASEIRNLALMISLFHTFPPELSPLYEKIFQQSLCSAIASDIISEQAGMKNRDDAFLAGLMLFIGKFILVHYAADDFLRVMNEAEVRGMDLEVVEKKILGITNREAGEILCAKWSLPDSIKKCISTRENSNRVFNEEFSEDQLALMNASYLGGLASKIFFGWNKVLNISRFKESYKKLIIKSELDSTGILIAVSEKLKIAGAEFLVKIDMELSYDSILGKAAAELEFLNKKYTQTYLELWELKEKQKENILIMK